LVKSSRSILAIVLLTLIMPLFQNCGEGFESFDSLESEDALPSEPVGTFKQNIFGFECLPAETVKEAVASSLIYFSRDLDGGAHTKWFHYAEMILALQASCGDSSVDQRLLEQVKYVLVPGQGITAMGGYADQHQIGMLTVFSIVKQIDRLWEKLSVLEMSKIDLMMEAALVSGAFVSSDENPFVKSNTQQHSLDGGINFKRSWNPNFREGTLGNVLVAASYFGVSEAMDKLANHNHRDFITELKNNNLNNLVVTYEMSDIPSAEQIEETLHKPFSYYGLPLNDLLGLYDHVSQNTYGAEVNCGLNEGSGLEGGGYLIKGCEALNNRGQAGMLLEFDSTDAGGPRSSLDYAFSGLRANTTNRIALIVNEQWKDNDMTEKVLNQSRVGAEDFYYKLNNGYHDYYKGKAQGVQLRKKHRGHSAVEEVLKSLEVFHNR